MLGNSPYLTQQAFAQANGRFLSTNRINHIYRFAQLKGRFAKLWAHLTHQSRKLLDSKLIYLGDAHYAGVRTVLIDQIKGSEGRNDDFDSAFYPLKTHNKDRWVSVAAARLRGVVLPPVDLLRVGDIYFVRDGHHRISVARAFGEAFIDAVVTVFEVK